MFFLIALSAFLSVALGGYALASWFQQRLESARVLAIRLRKMTGRDEPGSASVLRDDRLSRIAFLNALLARISVVRPLVRMIRQAGLKKRVGEVLLYVPLLGAVGILFTEVVGGGPALALMAGIAFAAAPLLVIQRRRRKRAQLFAEQLPDALDLIHAGLHAGHALIGTLNLVADEFPDPIAQEFREVAEENRLGLPLRDALYNMVERIDDPDLPILVVGILVADETGGNLAEVLDNIGHTIRERFKLLRDMRAMTAQGRLSGTVLTALPFIVGALMCLVNPTYFAPMIKTQLGQYLLIGAFFSLLCGHFVVRRLVQIRV
jgi:tight adherence protein B